MRLNHSAFLNLSKVPSVINHERDNLKIIRKVFRVSRILISIKTAKLLLNSLKNFIKKNFEFPHK